MLDVLPGQLKNLGGWVVERRFRVLILRLKIVPVASGLERRWRGAGIRHEKIRRTKIGYAGVGYVCWGGVELGGAAQALPQTAAHTKSSSDAEEGKGGRYRSRG